MAVKSSKKTLDAFFGGAPKKKPKKGTPKPIKMSRKLRDMFG